MGSPSRCLSQQYGETQASTFPQMTPVLIAIRLLCNLLCMLKVTRDFCFLAEVLPTTELNYKSLADVWKYIIEELHTSTTLFGSVRLCTVQLLVYSICK